MVVLLNRRAVFIISIINCQTELVFLIQMQNKLVDLHQFRNSGHGSSANLSNMRSELICIFLSNNLWHIINKHNVILFIVTACRLNSLQILLIFLLIKLFPSCHGLNMLNTLKENSELNQRKLAS